jgi:hypothetical protein
LIGGVHNGAGVLLDINLIWISYIAGYPSGEGAVFTRSNDFYLGGRRWENSYYNKGSRTSSFIFIRPNHQVKIKASKALKDNLTTVGAGLLFATCLNLSSPRRFAGANWFSEVRTTTADTTLLSQTTTKATFSTKHHHDIFTIWRIRIWNGSGKFDSVQIKIRIKEIKIDGQ